MTYNDIVDLILLKLDITPEEARYDGTLRKIAPLLNEGLGHIANKSKPNYSIKIFDILQGDGIADKKSIITFDKYFISLTNEAIRRIELVFSNGEWVESGDLEYIDGRHFVRFNSREIKVPFTGKNYRYYIQVTEHFPRINKDTPDAELDIEQSVLDLLPNYVISEILRNIDITTSTVFRNLYEDGLASLNDSVLQPIGTVYNEGF